MKVNWKIPKHKTPILFSRRAEWTGFDISNPETVMPIMTQLACSLFEATDVIELKENSRIRSIYSKSEITEQYHCNFGFSPDYLFLFEKGEMKITGADTNGEPRVVELTTHPFFIATLFLDEKTLEHL